MDFEEYIMAINCTNFTEPKDKLTWIFNVFDEVNFGSERSSRSVNVVCQSVC